MLLYKLLLSITDGLVFGFFSLGIYISFKWLKFPDLTPDGSFVIGACSYYIAIDSGVPAILALVIAFFAGFITGAFTSLLNQKIRIPAFIAGLLMASALYSIGWLILKKPNQFIENNQTLISWLTGKEYNYYLLITLIILSIIAVYFLSIFGNSIWGLRLRGIGENNKLSSDLNLSRTYYYTIGLGLANSFVALSGALFTQRSFSVDINMGIGQTIVGLIGMMIGVVIAMKSKSLYSFFLSIIVGTVIYKLLIWLTLELGFPAESFKLSSAIILIFLFAIIAKYKLNVLNDLRWN